MFSSKGFTILALTNLADDPFWVIFTWYEIGVQLSSFVCLHPIVLVSFVEKTILYPLNSLGALAEYLVFQRVGVSSFDDFLFINLFFYGLCFLESNLKLWVMQSHCFVYFLQRVYSLSFVFRYMIHF